jgi:hypothetical protein
LRAFLKGVQKSNFMLIFQFQHLLGGFVSLFVNFVTHYTTVHQLVLEPRLFSIMVRKRVHCGGNIYATIGDVYDREEAACGKQLTTYL